MGVKSELLKILDLLEDDLETKHGLGYTSEDIKRFKEDQWPKIPSICAWPLYFCVNSGKRQLYALYTELTQAVSRRRR